jgi:hypothetical protein
VLNNAKSLQRTFGNWYWLVESRPDLQLWGPRGNQNVEVPIRNNKYSYDN